MTPLYFAQAWAIRSRRYSSSTSRMNSSFWAIPPAAAAALKAFRRGARLAQAPRDGERRRGHARPGRAGTPISQGWSQTRKTA